MYAKKSPFRAWPLVMVLLLLIGAGIGSAAAKYISTKKMEAKVTFTAKLADDLLLQEHEAVRQPDGSYVLSDKLLPAKVDGTLVKGNKYFLLPGLDIPKDPFVQVVNKTPIRGYLYVEVVETVDALHEAIEYQMAPAWIKLEGLTGKNGGTVYVYTTGTTKVLTHENCSNDIIPILTNPEGSEHEIKVSQHLLEHDNSADDVLTFYAYLFESYEETGYTENTDAHIKYMYTYHKDKIS